MKNLNLVFFVLLLIGLISLEYPKIVSAQNIAIDKSMSSKDFNLDDDSVTVKSNDPFERYNRWMFRINDRIYRRVFTPVSHGYDKVVPMAAQKGINNFSHFLRTPIRFVNNILQLKFRNACTELGRFAINGTVGLVGIFDPAETQLGLHEKSEDFAQTLGFYGIGSGPYIVLPLLGPSDPRDIIGIFADMATNPMTWVAANNDADIEKVYTAYQVVNNVNNYSYSVRDTYTRIMDGAIDEYIALEQVYLQNREKNIQK